MGRHAQPFEIAILKSADKNHPERYRNSPPKSDLPLGLAPDHMTPEGALCWAELSALALPGVLTGADRVMLELAASLLAEFRKDPAEFRAAKMGHLVGLLARFGMSPTDRQKVTAPPNSNPFDVL